MRIAVLGPAEVVGDDGAVRPLERKTREILTVLAVRAPQAVGVDELTDLLWDEPPPSATKTVQAHVSRLRTAVGAERVAGRRRNTYALVAGHGELDVAEVVEWRDRARRLAGEGRHDEAGALLQEARARWRGELELPATLAGHALGARWTDERRRLEEEHLAAVVAGTTPSAALPELRAATRADPLSEPTWALLVTALHRAGEQPAALRAFQSARTALAGVGLEPGPALRAAEQAVLAAAPPPRAASRAASGPPPDIRYARAGPANVAYTVIGRDRPDLLLLNPGLISIDGLQDGDHLAGAVDRLGHVGRVIALDRRGIGLSDPLPAGADVVTAWSEDALAVCGAAGASRPVVVANADTGLVALTLAALHPDRVRALVLVHAYASYVRSPAYPYGVDPDTARAVSADVLTTDGDRPDRFDPLSHIAPSVAGDPGFRRWWDTMGRRAASPAAAAALHAVVHETDVRPIVPDVHVPVLVLHRRSCASNDVGHARYLAEHLPDARLTTLPGVDELWFTGDTDALIAAIGAFVAGLAD